MIKLEIGGAMRFWLKLTNSFVMYARHTVRYGNMGGQGTRDETTVIL
jgi:hypothetical protein